MIPEDHSEQKWLLGILRDKLTTSTKPAPLLVKSSIGGKEKKLRIGEQTHLKFFHFHDGEGFRLTLGLYNTIKTFMRGIPFNEENCIDLKKTAPAKYMLSPAFIPRGYQEEFLSFLDKDTISSFKLGGLPTGTGKAQPVEMMIPSPLGEDVRFGSLKVGDLVFGANGSPTRVTGTFPQGMVDTYRINFMDNTGTYACGEHLWAVKAEGELLDPDVIMDTLAVKKAMEKKTMSISKPYGPCMYIERSVKPKLNPYFLAYVMTKFDIQLGVLTSRDVSSLHLDKFIDSAPSGLDIQVTYRNGEAIEVTIDPSLFAILKSEGVDINAPHLRIPKRYKYSHPHNRKLLMMGLEDGVDYGKKKIKCRYMRRDWVKLVGSLTGNSMSKDKGLSEGASHTSFRREIKSIEKVDPQESMCISVEAKDSLYQCNDNIVTHNTVSAFFRMAELGCVTMIVLRPFLMQQWKREAKLILGLRDKDIMLVSGGKKFREVLDQAIKGRPKHKLYIVSNKTYYFYLKSFYTTTRTLKCDEILRYERRATHEQAAKLRALKFKDRDVYDQIVMKMERSKLLEQEKEYSKEYSHMPPEKFLPALGVGFTIVDEAHLDAHFNNTFYSTLGDVDHHLSLTATYFASEPVIDFVFSNTFSGDCIYDFLKMRKYIEYYQIRYRHTQGINPFSYTNAGMYSHNKYCVQKLVKPNPDKPKTFLVNTSYVKMIEDIINNMHFYDGYDEGDKVIIFVASLNLAVGLSTTLKRRYPDKTVIKYTGEEKDVNILITADITVLTIGKGAVGLDIRKLTTVMNCTSIAALALNVQILGRARYSGITKEEASKIPPEILKHWNKLEDDDDHEYEKPVRFIQLFCDSLPPQTKHRVKRHPYLEERTKFMRMDGNRSYSVTP